MKPFRYLAPKSLHEACAFIEEHYEDAKVLAGGQSLLPIMKLNLTEFGYLVDLKRIPDLAFIRVEKDDSSDGKDALVVGALTTHSAIAQSGVTRDLVPLLSETARQIGHPLVRNRGTVGGSLSHCDPAADLCVSSLALDARMVAVRKNNVRRTIRADDFFVDVFATSLENGEILEKIWFPIPLAGTGYGFEKFTLGHGDFPLIVVSTLLRVQGKKCLDVAIAVGGVSNRAVRMREAEDSLRGKSIDLEALSDVASKVVGASNPPSDLEVSASYKKRVVGVLTRRALTKALERSASVPS
jgi:carbon-monoxide dehydrogenase medium subunit